MGSTMITDDIIVSEALKIVESGERNGIILRIMGACAIRLHCKNTPAVLKAHRKLTDVDLMSYEKFESKMEELFKSLNYSPIPTIMPRGITLGRHIYVHNNIKLMVDVFFDKLEMCHTIDFRNRLHLDYPTIPLSELLLEKLQIVKIAEKDILDVIALLYEHEISESDEKDCINGKHIARLLSKDWGFYYTITTNLNKVESYLAKFEHLTQDEKTIVCKRIKKLIQMIESEPKSLSWKLRAKIGPSMKWYREVEVSPFESVAEGS